MNYEYIARNSLQLNILPLIRIYLATITWFWDQATCKYWAGMSHRCHFKWPEQSNIVCTITTPILQMKKMRLSSIKLMLRIKNQMVGETGFIIYTIE